MNLNVSSVEGGGRTGGRDGKIFFLKMFVEVEGRGRRGEKSREGGKKFVVLIFQPDIETQNFRFFLF